MRRADNEAEHRHALVAGGGSGGHVFPGVALAHELERRRWKVSFVGRPGGFEERLATGAGLTYHALDAAPMLGASVTQKLRSLLTLSRAAAAGRRLVRSQGADVVVGLGGYVSVPAVVGAKLAGRPILLFEPNASAGSANRWLSKMAAGAAVAYEASRDAFRCPTTVTGTPVRPDFFRQPDEPPEPLSVLVLGGSQGARQLNELVPRALAGVGSAGEGLHIFHQAGEGAVEETEALYESCAVRLGGVEVVPFIDDVASALGSCHLIISRAGAITLAEICAVGRPAVLVPLAIAGAHQVDNARALVDAEAAVALTSDVEPTTLAGALGRLLESPGQRRLMGDAARRLARPDAVIRFADRVDELVEAA